LAGSDYYSTSSTGDDRRVGRIVLDTRRELACHTMRQAVRYPK
jgi:hypothetical protein